MKWYLVLTCTVISFPAILAVQNSIGKADPLTSGQDSPNNSLSETYTPINSSLNIDKNFELNISERQIIQQDYKASTAIRLGEPSAQGVSLQVGAAVRANEVNIRLQNINGEVHFHARGERLQQSIRSHQRDRQISN